MNNSFLVLIVDEYEHFEIAEEREFDSLFQESFLPFTVGDLSMAQIVNLSNLIDSFPHLYKYYSIRV